MRHLPAWACEYTYIAIYRLLRAVKRKAFACRWMQAGIADESLLHATGKDEHDPHSGDDDSDGNETVRLSTVVHSANAAFLS